MVPETAEVTFDHIPGECAASGPAAQPRVPRATRFGKNIPDAPTGRRPEPLRSVTLRLRASIADALRRESIRRSLDYIEPFSQQAIVEAAVHSWLCGQGCPIDD